MKFSIFLILLLAWTKLTFAQPNPTDEVQSIIKKFNVTMMECPHKIWANYNWNGLKVILVYPSQDKSWVWDASSNSLNAVLNSSLPASAIGSTYEFLEISGSAALSLNMEEKDSDYFEFGVHEFFHNQGQKNWTSENLRTGRGTEYPASSRARLYRRMIFDNLKKYFEFGYSENLGKAKYWFDKWVKQFPNEAASSTDGYEGTAQYVGILAQIVSEKGCAVSDVQLKAAALAKIKSNDFGFSVRGLEFALDSEGYEVGGLAAIILRFSNKSLHNWNAKMSKGATPVQVLLENVESVVEDLPQELAAKFEESEKKINTENGILLDESIANWTNKNFFRVATPYDWLQSNLMPRFFARTSTLNMELYPLSVDHQYVSPIGSSKFKLSANSVIFDYNNNSACAGQSSYTLVSASSVKALEAKKYLVSSETISGHLIGEIKVDDQGYEYICVE